MRALLLMGWLLAAAQGAGLGLLTARGSVKLNGFRVWGNGTVTNRMTVLTEAVGARITLNSGAEILLAPASRIRFADADLVLEQGSVVVRVPGATQLKAPHVTTATDGSLSAGPDAARIPEMLEHLTEQRPLSQRP